MQGSALAREAMSSAAVTLYAAAVLPHVPPECSAQDLAQGLFMPTAPGTILGASAEGTDRIYCPFKHLCMLARSAHTLHVTLLIPLRQPC